LDLYQQMRSAGQQSSDGELQLIALTETAKIYSTPTALFDPAKGGEFSDQAVELARQQGNPEAEARTLWNRSNSEMFAGEVARAVEFGDRSLELAQQFDLREQMAFTLNDLSRPLMMLGQLDRAQQVNARARQLWRELENLPMLGDNFAGGAMAAYWLGQFDQAISEAQESYRITKSIGNIWGQAASRVWIGLSYFEVGRLDLAIDTLTECVDLSREGGIRLAILIAGSFLALTYSTLGAHELSLIAYEQAASVDRSQFPHVWPIVPAVSARLMVRNGQVGEARRASEESYIGLKPVGSLNVADIVLLADAEISLAEGNPQRAVERLDQMLELAAAARRRPAVPEALLLRGRSLRALGEFELARDALQRALKEAEELGSGRVLWRILLEQSRLEAESGNSTDAEQLRARAGSAIAELVTSIDDPELRRSFTALPDAREALAGQVGAAPPAA
jgi:tetratricopeptide (TPR) repeat protein